MKIADVPCGKIENENPHICFENENCGHRLRNHKI